MTLDEYDIMKNRAEKAEAEVERLKKELDVVSEEAWHYAGFLHNHDICIICGEKWKDSCFDHEDERMTLDEYDIIKARAEKAEGKVKELEQEIERQDILIEKCNCLPSWAYTATLEELKETER